MKYLTDFTIPLSLLDRQWIADSQHSPHASVGQLPLCDGDVYRLRCVPTPVADGPTYESCAFFHRRSSL